MLFCQWKKLWSQSLQSVKHCSPGKHWCRWKKYSWQWLLVLASGSFFSKGLVSEFDKIYEPVFHSDIIGVEGFNDTDRFTWTDHRFSNPQPYQSAGVAINAQCQVQKSGQFLTNLYAVGNVIGGFNALELGCGSGVAVVTALAVADEILHNTH